MQFEIRKRPVSFGTEESDHDLPQFNGSDCFRMYLKYEGQKLWVKDSGFGLGVFILRERYQIKPFRNKGNQIIINYGSSFVTL